MTIKPKIYRQRRKHLAALLNRGIAIVRNSSDQIRSNDTHYPYRSNSYFHYLSGFPESESILVISSKLNQSFIFTKTKNKEKEIWDGFIYGPKKAAQDFLFEAGLDCNWDDWDESSQWRMTSSQGPLAIGMKTSQWLG